MGLPGLPPTGSTAPGRVRSFLRSILLPIRGDSFCGHVRGCRVRSGGRTHGEGVQESQDFPLPGALLRVGCGAFLGSTGANPGTLVVPPMSVCWGCDARRALRPVPSRLGVSASYTPLCCGGRSRGWGGVWGRGSDSSHWSHRGVEGEPLGLPPSHSLPPRPPAALLREQGHCANIVLAPTTSWCALPLPRRAGEGWPSDAASSSSVQPLHTQPLINWLPPSLG